LGSFSIVYKPPRMPAISAFNDRSGVEADRIDHPTGAGAIVYAALATGWVYRILPYSLALMRPT